MVEGYRTNSYKFVNLSTSQNHNVESTRISGRSQNNVLNTSKALPLSKLMSPTTSPLHQLERPFPKTSAFLLQSQSTSQFQPLQKTMHENQNSGEQTVTSVSSGASFRQFSSQNHLNHLKRIIKLSNEKALKCS